MKRVALAGLACVLLAGVALVLFARSALAGDQVRAALAAQVSAALGQPVAIEGLDVSLYPRVTIDLTGVSIGESAQVRMRSMHFVTNLRALFSRRLEHAAVHIEGARVTLPLLALRSASPPATTSADTEASVPVHVVSIDEIVLRNVELVRGDRTLRGDVELVPQPGKVELRRLTLAVDEATIEATGAFTSFDPIAGHVDVTTPNVNVDRLIVFIRDFVGPPSASAPTTATSAAAVPRLTVSLSIASATTGGLTLNAFRANGVVTPAAISLRTLAFRLFDGNFQGTLDLAIETPPRFIWKGDVAAMKMAAVMAFAGAPSSITGTLAGRLVLEGSGAAMEQALRSARGTASVRITDGAIAGLSLVRTLVVATSGRGGYGASAQRALESRTAEKGDERFDELQAALSMADGIVRISDFVMRSPDLDMTADGTLALATSTADLAGRVTLSEALSKQGGTDLYRYAQENGRVTLPTTVRGPLGALRVGVDVREAAARAIRNRVAEEAQKAIERNLPGSLKGLFPKRPPR
jgi:uncharacterized protein involved in outer membrane biogenesis